MRRGTQPSCPAPLSLMQACALIPEHGNAGLVPRVRPEYLPQPARDTGVSPGR
jgi:hypothetical protein